MILCLCALAVLMGLSDDMMPSCSALLTAGNGIVTRSLPNVRSLVIGEEMDAVTRVTCMQCCCYSSVNAVRMRIRMRTF